MPRPLGVGIVGCGEAAQAIHLPTLASLSDQFRVVQMTPPGSACSITIMAPPSEAPGSLQGTHLIVTDIEAARAELTGRGVEAGDFFHFGEQGQTDGLHPDRADYGTFFSFSDPDGNGWLVQEVRSR